MGFINGFDFANFNQYYFQYKMPMLKANQVPLTYLAWCIKNGIQ